MIATIAVFASLAGASPPVPEATLYGCYQTVSQWMYPDMAREHYRDQYEHGMRCGTVSGNGAEFLAVGNMPMGVARQIDLMIEEGICPKHLPQFVLSCGPEDMKKAEAYAQHPDQWPDIFIGNVDEPNVTQMRWVREHGHEARSAGYRSGTAITGYGLFQDHETVAMDGHLADWLDVWIVLASTWQDALRQKAFESQSELSAYWAYPREPDRDRYIAGLWCWKQKPVRFYWWAYTHTAGTGVLPSGKQVDGAGDEFRMVYPSPNGPVETEAWAAIREGIEDHYWLERLEKKHPDDPWLAELRDSIPEVVPVPPKPVPIVTFEEIRKVAQRRLRK